MASERIVVIGASSGGIEALRVLVSALPADFAAPICVVVHVAATAPGILNEILSRAGKLPAFKTVSLMALRPGRIYVAPPDYHLLVERDAVRTSRGPRENRFRPAIDPLFRSAARAFGPAAVGVVLTGDLDDGTAGLWEIKNQGGVAIVQQPEDALFPSMPNSAIRHVAVDHIVPIKALAPLLVQITSASLPPVAPVPIPRHLEVEMDIANGAPALDVGIERIGKPSPYACPDCHGVLLEVKADGPLRFRCHTGHAYSVASLIAALDDGIEDAAWNAIRSLDEGGMLIERVARHLAERHTDGEAERLVERSREVRDCARAIRNLLATLEPPSAPEEA
jgi:two-component system chemotaxis response regulator CheB